MMFSCQELTIDSQPDAPVSIYIDALDSYSLAGTAPGRIVFNISSNTPWTITSDSQCRCSHHPLSAEFPETPNHFAAQLGVMNAECIMHNECIRFADDFQSSPH